MAFNKVVALALIWLLIGCTNNRDQSFDFTEEHLFTPGIEGPAVDSRGNLYAVNFESEGTIGMVNSDGEASLFARLPEGSVGNGIRFDSQDNMYIADYVKHNVLLIRKGSREAEVYAHDPALSQPNDLAMSPSGVIYAPDRREQDL